jgi:hypothetical protein
VLSVQVGHLQNFIADLLRGCDKAGIQFPPRMSCVPDSIIVWHNPVANFPGETMAKAFEAAKRYFNKDPNILFVVLPERGAFQTQMQLPSTLLSNTY